MASSGEVADYNKLTPPHLPPSLSSVESLFGLSVVSCRNMAVDPFPLQQPGQRLCAFYVWCCLVSLLEAPHNADDKEGVKSELGGCYGGRTGVCVLLVTKIRSDLFLKLCNVSKLAYMIDVT